MSIRCCKKGCKILINSNWLCDKHNKEWNASRQGNLSRQLTVASTEEGLRKEVSDDFYDQACQLYKKYIMS